MRRCIRIGTPRGSMICMVVFGGLWWGISTDISRNFHSCPCWRSFLESQGIAFLISRNKSLFLPREISPKMWGRDCTLAFKGVCRLTLKGICLRCPRLALRNTLNSEN